jgi:hypothetical protein
MWIGGFRQNIITNSVNNYIERENQKVIQSLEMYKYKDGSLARVFCERTVIGRTEEIRLSAYRPCRESSVRNATCSK